MSDTDKLLEELLLDLKTGRYGMVALARDWVQCLRKTDEGVGLSEAELIKKSLRDIISGEVKEKDIHSAFEKIKSTLLHKKEGFKSDDSDRKNGKGRK